MVNCLEGAESFIRIKRYRDCLVTIFIVFEGIKVIGLSSHLVVVVRLWQIVDSLGNLAHFFDCLVNLARILEESLASY